MERPFVSASLQKVAESNFNFSISNFEVARVHDIYKSESVKFSEISGDWNMTATVCNTSYKSLSLPLKFMIKSNMPNSLDYERYTVKVDVCARLSDDIIISLTIPDTFLKKKLDLTACLFSDSQSSFSTLLFDIKLSLSCYSNSLNYLDTNVAWKQIINNNISLLSDSTYSDFTFVVEATEFRVHKNILAAASQVFVTLFKSTMQESIKNVCVVNNIASNTFNHMLRFIYGGLLPNDIADIAFKLYEAAHYYDIKNLMDICKKSIRLNLSVSNACSVFLWAELFNMEDLKSSALKQLKIDQNQTSPETITSMIEQGESELLRKQSELLLLRRLVNLPRSNE